MPSSPPSSSSSSSFDYVIPIAHFLRIWLNEPTDPSPHSESTTVSRRVSTYIQHCNVPAQMFIVNPGRVFLTAYAIDLLQPRIDHASIAQYREHVSSYADTGLRPETVPDDVAQYMDALTTTYRQSKDPNILNDMLKSEETSKIGEFLATTRPGTLTRSQPDKARDELPPHVLKMDPFSEQLVQWLFHVADEKPEIVPSLAAAVRSGNLLFTIAKYMLPKPPQSKYLLHESQYSVHKIIYFLDCCQIVGVPNDLAFPLTSLMVDDDDPRPISRTIIEFEKNARKKAGSAVKWPQIPTPGPGYFTGEWAPVYETVPDITMKHVSADPSSVLRVDTDRKSTKLRAGSTGPALPPIPGSGPALPPRPEDRKRRDTNDSLGVFVPVEQIPGQRSTKYGGTQDDQTLEAIFQSLLYHEELYLKDLQVVVDWMNVLNTSYTESPITPPENGVLFRNICALRDLHDGLYTTMKTYDRPDDSKTKVEAVALSILRVASELLREYEEHAVNSKHVTTLLEQAGDRPALKQMITDFSNWAQGYGLSLESYLARPGEHLVVYARKFEQLRAKGADGPNVRRATEVLNSMIGGIEKKRSMVTGNARSRVSSYLVPMVVDNQEPAVEDVGHGTPTLRRVLNQAVDIATLESATRRFICQGSVWEVVKAVEVKVRSLLLFHDALIIAKEVPPSQYEVRTILDLRNITIRPTRDRARAALRLRPVVAQAVQQFNHDPFKAFKELISQKVIDGSPNNTASFLHKTPNLSRRRVGKYIGHADNEHIAYSYTTWYSPIFAHLLFEDALRLFLSSVRLGNDGQAIDRVLSSFARTYFDVNPDQFKDEQAAVDLVFATVLLNADVHGPGSSGSEKKTRDHVVSLVEFIQNHPRVAAEQVQSVYESIQSEKLAMASDRTGRVAVDVFAIPTHLTLNEPTEWLRISIPVSDPLVTLRMLASPALTIEPSVIAFSDSDTGYIRITASQTGRHRIYFLLGGDSAPHYDYILPLTVVVEAPYMRHTFSVEFPRTPHQTDQVSSRASLTFSVASDEQRQRWVSYLANAIDQLKYSAEI